MARRCSLFIRRVLAAGGLLLITGCQPHDEAANSASRADDGWPTGFEEVEIANPVDAVVQKAYLRTASLPGRPLAVVLHTWSGDYTQQLGSLADQVLARDWNYIHPDFRGPNRGPEACCSDAVLSDIDAAVRYAVEVTRADPDQVHVIGLSGGGYAALCMFMNTQLDVESYSAWVPVADLVAWHSESEARGNGYADDILACTGSEDGLDAAEARRRSPMFMRTPVRKLETTTLRLYTGIHDGYEGSVPVSHSLLFYNKVLGDTGVRESRALVSPADLARLVGRRASPDSSAERLGDRRIIYMRSHRSVSVTVFEGAHEILPDVALDGLR